MKLLEPLTINSMTIPNRVLVPAMVTRLSGEDGYVNQAVIDRYVRFAQGGVGLIVVEASAVHGSKSGPLLRLSDDDFIPGHRDLVERVHDAGPSKIVPQIIHFMKVARSGWRQTVDMLEIADIDRIVEEFGLATLRVREAGYDGIEIHSAHAYTLSSFLSRHNHRRDDYSGKTLEGRLRMFGRVMTCIRQRVGADFPVGVRFLAEEVVRDGYTIEDAKPIALRMAQLGVDYISLSVGGKFEDAVQREGQPLYPYTGYSGDRCMPGAWYPALPNAHLAAAIKAYLNAHGFDVPVVSVGKISAPVEAEQLLRDGRADIIGMARQLLADPDWVNKVAQGRADDIVRCIYCNVCKQLDGSFRKVNCFLWPKGMDQAPADDPDGEAPAWGDDQGGLTGEIDAKDRVILEWRAPVSGDTRIYDIYRAEENGDMTCLEAVKTTHYRDPLTLGGLSYTYYIRAIATDGRASPPSNAVRVTPELPNYAGNAKARHA
jgi:2,4-dienoyl-CoA reductase-like NADH-dependent reductase (Old Yellow Enzyme family)